MNKTFLGTITGAGLILVGFWVGVNQSKGRHTRRKLDRLRVRTDLLSTHLVNVKTDISHLNALTIDTAAQIKIDRSKAKFQGA